MNNASPSSSASYYPPPCRGERTVANFIYVACDGSARHVWRKCGAYGLPPSSCANRRRHDDGPTRTYPPPMPTPPPNCGPTPSATGVHQGNFGRVARILVISKLPFCSPVVWDKVTSYYKNFLLSQQNHAADYNVYSNLCNNAEGDKKKIKVSIRKLLGVLLVLRTVSFIFLQM